MLRTDCLIHFRDPCFTDIHLLDVFNILSVQQLGRAPNGCRILLAS
jgi:hypothetical protein